MIRFQQYSFTFALSYELRKTEANASVSPHLCCYTSHYIVKCAYSGRQLFHIKICRIIIYSKCLPYLLTFGSRFYFQNVFLRSALRVHDALLDLIVRSKRRLYFSRRRHKISPSRQVKSSGRKKYINFKVNS